MKLISNFFTIDIEDWHCINYAGVVIDEQQKKITHIEKNVDTLLYLCDKHKVKATCFVLGELAQTNPKIIKKLSAEGHEIASHGYFHRSIFSLTPLEFQEDIQRSIDVIQNLTGNKVEGYRAPSFSITQGCAAWYYQILEELGLSYSSSIFPGKTFLYGISGFPSVIHRPTIGGKQFKIFEIPAPVVKLFGYDLGLYPRLFPSSFINTYISSKNYRNEPVFLYVHPREIDSTLPTPNMSFTTRIIHNWGINGCEKKLDRVLKRFNTSFVLMKDYIKEISAL